MTEQVLADLKAALGAEGVLEGADCAPWSRDWNGMYFWQPLCVVRPRSTAEVSAVLRIAHGSGTAVVPVSGNTSLAGGTKGEASIMLSLDRMNRIREVRAEARLAVVEAGVIMSELHAAAEARGLTFPMTFGAKGSARVGGFLSTNAGGSNVLRYGNTRDLVLGLEAVMADGQVMNLMSELHKDNSGLNLKHLLIGAEGTLGVITAAVVKLVPTPGAYATATVATATLEDALVLLNRLQAATGGAVEAFEYMCERHMQVYQDQLYPQKRWPFEGRHPVTILVEVGATAPRDVTPGDDGQVPVVGYLEEVLAGLMEEGTVLDAVVARSEGQRREMWERREAAAEVSLTRHPLIITDIAVGIDRVPQFLSRFRERLPQVDPGADGTVVSHLGDGNVHYTVWPSSQDPALAEAIMEMVEDEALALGGSFSAEHGIGLSKKGSMARRKDKVAVAAMKAIKAALDPRDILNPGKVFPD